MKKALIIVIFIIILLIIVFISKFQTKDMCYAGIVVINGEQYIYKGEPDEDVIIGSYIGVVSHKVGINTMPENNFESNMLSKGTKLYKALNKDNIIIAINNGEKFMFKKVK